MKFRKLRLQTGLTPYETPKTTDDVYRLFSERIYVEGLEKDVFGLGGAFMERWKALGVRGLERPEKAPFKILTTDHEARLQGPVLNDVSIAVLGAVTGLEMLSYDDDRRIAEGVIPGFAMLSAKRATEDRLMENMGVIVEEVMNLLVKKHGAAVRVQFAYGPGIEGGLPCARKSPVIPHVMRFQGCPIQSLFAALRDTLRRGVLPAEDAMLFHYVMP